VRRLLVTAFAVAAAGAFVVTGGAAGAPEDQRYTVEMDNAFGLIEGADLKIAGVRSGKIKTMEIDPNTYRALIEVDITRTGFGSLRQDVYCESRPQSLIGEYYLDCLPGRSPNKLKPGSRIPVRQTASTVPADLINDIMRRPFRERFTILLNQLGAALASRGEDLNVTIRRAVPALRETDKVLRILAEQRTVIRDLVKNADTVLVELANNRRDVGRFVQEARDTSAASAERAGDIERQFQLLPTFLRELRPTMAALGEVADAQTPALQNLHREAGRLEDFLNTLGPFSDASRPATRSLASAARAGSPALRAADPQITELRKFARQAPETATNLALTLEDLDNRNRAVERDARAPEGRGYTGFEAILQYVFNQSQAINLFDNNSYMLKVTAFGDTACQNYADATIARMPDRQRCRAILGPNQPGIDQPAPGPRSTTAEREAQLRAAQDQQIVQQAQGGAQGQRGAQAPRVGGTQGGLVQQLGALINGAAPNVQVPNVPGAPTPQRDNQTTGDLLGFLFGP
jgi:ABC-type transporter Mla subunit MlaD